MWALATSAIYFNKELFHSQLSGEKCCNFIFKSWLWNLWRKKERDQFQFPSNFHPIKYHDMWKIPSVPLWCTLNFDCTLWARNNLAVLFALSRWVNIQQLNFGTFSWVIPLAGLSLLHCYTASYLQISQVCQARQTSRVNAANSVVVKV